MQTKKLIIILIILVGQYGCLENTLNRTIHNNDELSAEFNILYIDGIWRLEDIKNSNCYDAITVDSGPYLSNYINNEDGVNIKLTIGPLDAIAVHSPTYAVQDSELINSSSSWVKIKGIQRFLPCSGSKLYGILAIN